MAECPHCGGDVEAQHTYCPDCGTALAGAGASPADPGGTDSGADTDASGPESAGTDPDPVARGPESAVEQNAGGSSPVSRRGLLVGGGLLGVAAAGGGLFVLLDGGSPVDPVEQSFTAFNNSNFERFNESFHPDAPFREFIDSEYRERFGPEAGTTYIVKSREVVNRTESEAVVQETLVRDADDQPAPEEYVSNWTVRKHEGEWKIWENEFVSSNQSG